MTNSNPVISVKNIDIAYSSGTPFLRSRTKHSVLKNISFDLHEGDSLGIIGKNGAGKSTLLKLLNGVIKPDSGEIINHGYSTALLTFNLGYDQNLTGRQNAVIAGMMMGLAKTYIVSKLNEINALAGLGQFFDRPIKSYSTGMKQRLCFSVAIYLKADVLLIDEILSVGDFNFRKTSEEIMRNKITSGNTVVLVSHNATTVKRLCNKALWIENGSVVRYGTSTEVVKAYEDAQKSENPVC